MDQFNIRFLVSVNGKTCVTTKIDTYITRFISCLEEREKNQADTVQIDEIISKYYNTYPPVIYIYNDCVNAIQRYSKTKVLPLDIFLGGLLFCSDICDNFRVCQSKRQHF